MNIVNPTWDRVMRAHSGAAIKLYDKHPNAGFPYIGFSGLTYGVSTVEQMTEVRRILGLGMWNRNYTEMDYLIHTYTPDGIKVTISTPRESACERIVTGTKSVTREIPDPEALAAVPMITVTEDVDEIEWKCLPA